MAQSSQAEFPVPLAAVAKPGDTIILGFVRAIGDEEYTRIKESFQPLIDRGIQIALADQISSMVVVKGEA